MAPLDKPQHLTSEEHFQKQRARARAIELGSETFHRVVLLTRQHKHLKCTVGLEHCTGCTHVSLHTVPCTNSEFGFVVDKGTGTHVHHTSPSHKHLII